MISGTEELNARSVTDFPPLPKLKTLEFEINLDNSIVRPWICAIVKRYILQLRSLSLDFKCFQEIINASGHFGLPLLGDLELHGISVFGVSPGKEIQDTVHPEVDHFRKLMSSLDCPQLSRLVLDFCCATFHPPLSFDSDVFPWLERFQKLQSFHIGNRGLGMEETGALANSPRFHEHLTFLQICLSRPLNYNFLLSLPNLQYLVLNVDDKPGVLDLSDGPNPTNPRLSWLSIWTLEVCMKVIFGRCSLV